MLCYATDEKHVYLHASIVNNADMVTFKIYEYGYGGAHAEEVKNNYLEGVKGVVE